MNSIYPYYLANQPQQPNTDLAVTDKYTGETVSRVALASPDSIDQAIAAACDARKPMQDMPPYERKAVLEQCIQRFNHQQDDLADILCIEAGKPIKDSRGEVTRLIDTFQIAAEEAVRPHGEMHEFEIGERTQGYSGMSRRVPIGPCSFISPFNFPLNLTAHKIAPAIAAGCPFILKPASLTPIGALIIGDALAETDLPRGAFSILPCTRDGADLFTTDERLKLLSFTGSPDVGWALKKKAGKKKVILELGGNAACIIEPGTDLDDAVDRLIAGAFYQSGQSCISVQRILVHRDIEQTLTEKLVKKTKVLKSGNPKDEDMFIGPMISEKEAERVEHWITQAVEKGAEILCGGTRDNAMVEATLLKNVPTDVDLYREEVFGPVALIEAYSNFDEALEKANDSRFGIHAGVFTPRIDQAMKAWDELEVGGVLINEIPSWRVDNMPYGGVKDSGLGREGIRYAIEDMTENRCLVFRKTP